MRNASTDHFPANAPIKFSREKFAFSAVRAGDQRKGYDRADKNFLPPSSAIASRNQPIDGLEDDGDLDRKR